MTGGHRRAKHVGADHCAKNELSKRSNNDFRKRRRGMRKTMR